MDAFELGVSNLPQKSHLSEANYDLGEVVPLSKPRSAYHEDFNGISKEW